MIHCSLCFVVPCVSLFLVFRPIGEYISLDLFYFPTISSDFFVCFLFQNITIDHEVELRVLGCRLTY